MKRFLSFLLLLLTGSLRVLAAPIPHFAVTFTGSVVTQVTSGSSGFTISASKFNNATILNALVTSGSFGVSSPGALDIVFDINGNLNVINRSTLAVIYSLGVDGTNYGNTGGYITGSPARAVFRAASQNYSINLPGRPTYTCNAMQTIGVNALTNQLTAISIFLQGGFNSLGDPGDVFLQGTIRKGRKVYTF